MHRQTARPVAHLERHMPRLEDRSPGDPQVLTSSSIKVKVRGCGGAPRLVCNTVHISEIPPNQGCISQFSTDSSIGKILPEQTQWENKHEVIHILYISL